MLKGRVSTLSVSFSGFAFDTWQPLFCFVVNRPVSVCQRSRTLEEKQSILRERGPVKLPWYFLLESFVSYHEMYLIRKWEYSSVVSACYLQILPLGEKNYAPPAPPHPLRPTIFTSLWTEEVTLSNQSLLVAEHYQQFVTVDSGLAGRTSFLLAHRCDANSNQE